MSKLAATRCSLSTVALAGLLFASAHSASATDFDAEVPLVRHASGNLYVDGELAPGIAAEFLLDTGAGVVSVSEALFDRLSDRTHVEPAGRVAARLANGRFQAMNLYKVASFRIGGSCEIGPVEIAVMPGSDRNILGLSALSKAAPFAVHVTPPKLVLSGCPIPGDLAAVP